MSRPRSPLDDARDLLVDLDDLVARADDSGRRAGGGGRGGRAGQAGRGGRGGRSGPRRPRRRVTLAGALVALLVLVVVLVGPRLLDGLGLDVPGLDLPGAPVAVPTAVPEGADRATVERVVDGDTVVVEVDGARERLRLIGVDTPETVRPGAPVDCYGPEASAWAADALPAGATVWLEADDSQGDRDRYDRLLRYVWTASGTLVNRELIAQGLGREDTYDDAYRYQDDFRTAEREAEARRLGLWGAC